MKKELISLVAAGVLAVTLVGCGGGGDAKKETSASQPEVSQSEKTPKVETPTEPAMTTSQKNALSKAKDYLDFAAFSHDGLIKQLEFEKFSTEDATFAADNCGADWNAQAAKKAADYLELTSFSHDGLIEQLVFEGFTAEQAEYGASSTGL